MKVSKFEYLMYPLIIIPILVGAPHKLHKNFDGLNHAFVDAFYLFFEGWFLATLVVRVWRVLK